MPFKVLQQLDLSSKDEANHELAREKNSLKGTLAARERKNNDYIYKKATSMK